MILDRALGVLGGISSGGTLGSCWRFGDCSQTCARYSGMDDG